MLTGRVIIFICSTVSIDNIVQLGLSDTKIGSQDAVKKVLGLTER